ncbi:uncharacterized protein [Euphorbia lathyris]|uniref:uncharacterized protein isoform X2 n=1 Tax=Euphorbia lathyris TaxID=212925 RepID=UPI003313BFC7
MPSPSLFANKICYKLQTLASRHEQMKIAFHELKSQIKDGLLETNEVFASLAIPLMKLVGLKTKEMAEEGRFSSIIITNGFSHGASQSPDANDASEGEKYASRATTVGKELIEKQHKNIAQLVHLLRQIENHVNGEQEVILQNLGKHRLNLQKYFQKALSCIFSLHGQNKDTSFITQKLLQDIFNNVNAVLDSLESGVDNLFQGLAKKMCSPMVEYVKGLTDDLKNGNSRQLLAMVKEMERMMRKGKLEFEDARKQVRVAEEGKMEAICKLKTIEGSLKRKKQQLCLPEPPKRRVGYSGPATPHKLLGMDEEQATDDKLMWNLLNKKRKDNVQTSPMGPEGLLWFNANKNHCVRPSLERTRVTRSSKAVGLQTPSLNNNRIPLGSSPSLAIQPGARLARENTRVTRSSTRARGL